MVDEILGSPLSKSTVINLESEGSMAPSADINSFCCGSHVFSTSRADMDVGDWAKSSTMLYFTVALAVALLAIHRTRNHGPRVAPSGGSGGK